MTGSVLHKLKRLMAALRPRKRRVGAVVANAQFGVYSQRLPFAILGNLLNMAILLWAFSDDRSPQRQLWIWAGFVIALSVGRVLVYRNRRALFAAHGHAWLFRSTFVEAVLSSGSWAYIIGFLMPRTSPAMPMQIAFLGIMAAGMLNGGIFTFAVMPAAAYCYVIILTLGTAWGFVSLDGRFAAILLVLLASYCLIMHRAIKASYKDFHGRVMRGRELEDTAQTIRILLHDYESLGSDFLWEVDADGRITNAAARLSDIAGLDKVEVYGMKFADLFEDGEGKARLEQHLKLATPFRDLTLKLRGVGSPVWWRLSAGPIGAANIAETCMRGVATDVTSTKAAEARMRHMAFYDSLTNMPNRALFHETLAHSVSLATDDQPMAVMYLDLDNFKMVNDTLGHTLGDNLLEQVARRLEKCVGASGMVARLGGDEFAILLASPGSRAAVAKAAAAAIAEIDQPFSIDMHRVRSGISIGVVMSPQDSAKADELMKYADLALYAAKERGRNQYCFFEPAMDAIARRRMGMETGLRQALSRNELAMYYQPLSDINTGATVGFEALMRWHHPEYGDVPPMEFIVVAEEAGMIVQLGEWALRQAIEALAAWPEHIMVAVNLSAAQLTSRNLLSTITDALQAAGVTPQRLELEVTETVLLRQEVGDLQMLRQLRQFGMHVALDDFGTGYSSLNYLLQFPFNKIKIDKSFVDDVDRSEESRSIVRAVVTLAQTLGMTTIAEGVERQEQWDALRELGCMQAQGFLVSEPVPREQAQKFV